MANLREPELLEAVKGPVSQKCKLGYHGHCRGTVWRRLTWLGPCQCICHKGAKP